MTKSGLRWRVQRLADVGMVIVGLFFVTAITTAVVVPLGPVAADQVSDLRAQAAQIAQDLVLEQLQIGTYQQQYAVDVAKVEGDQWKIASSLERIQADSNRVSRDDHRLESEAVWAYVHLGPEINATQTLFEGNPNRVLARAMYEKVASGDITRTIDVLHIDEARLHAERSTLEQQEAQDDATTNQEATLAGDAHQTEVDLESKQSDITGELAVAVAQQQAAQAAAAAAAVRAAQAAAAAAAAATTSTTLPSARPTTTNTPQPVSSQAAPSVTSTATQGEAAGASSGDPSLPAFLQCALQAESSGNYEAVSPGGTYEGGFQFSQPTWNEAAGLAGMPQLTNVPPNQATPAEQDDLAIALYGADGEQPWDDDCRNN